MEQNKLRPILPGIRVLCVSNELLVLSNKYKIYISDVQFDNIREVGSLEIGIVRKIISNSKILRRLFRTGPTNAIVTRQQEVLISSDGSLFRIKLNKNQHKIVSEHRFRKEMRNCLSLCEINGLPQFDDSLCYGEYFNNPEKKEVSIWSSKIGQTNWEKVYTFKEGMIEHIHALIPDHYREVVWILTGDFDSSAGLWISKNNFATVEPVAIGKQEYRACVAFPLAEGLLYATDSQFEANSIRILSEKGDQWCSELVYPLEGSCIYACQVDDKFVFSTAVEPGEVRSNLILTLLDRTPGPGIKSSKSTIVVGNLQNGFKVIKEWEKDNWPLRLFQFGTITFPTGVNPTSKIYSYGIALKGLDMDTCIIELEQMI